MLLAVSLIYFCFVIEDAALYTLFPYYDPSHYFNATSESMVTKSLAMGETDTSAFSLMAFTSTSEIVFLVIVIAFPVLSVAWSQWRGNYVTEEQQRGEK